MSQKEINIMRTFEEGGSICRIISCVDNDRIYYKIETGNDTAHFIDFSEEEQKIVLEWLQWNVWPAKDKLDGHSSYGMKHILNNRTGIYITNNQMRVDRDEKGQIYYRYQLGADESHLDKAGTVDLSPKDVLHIPALGFDGLVGYSPIAMARNSIGMAIACEDFGASFFRNGAAPSGVLEHPGVLKNPEKLRAAWEAQYGGSRNSGRVAVLEEGMKFNPIAIPPEQAQFLETRKFQVDEIARIFHVPPHMIGDLERSTFSNIEQQSLEFVKYTLNPWVCRWEQALTRSLLSPKEKREYSIKFNVDGLLRGDYQSRMNGYAVGRQNGWMSANDIRELENMDKISEEQGGNLYLVNGNMIKMTDAATNPREKDSA